jgi:hypothetical protein
MIDPFQNDPSDVHGKKSTTGDDNPSTDKVEPLIVTIEPQTKNKDSYEAKQYRLDCASYRLNQKSYKLNRKAYRVSHRTMVYLLIYTGLTLVVAVSSVIASYYARKSADTTKQSVQAYMNSTSAYLSFGEEFTVGKEIPGSKESEATVDIINLGNSPAIDVEVFGGNSDPSEGGEDYPTTLGYIQSKEIRKAVTDFLDKKIELNERNGFNFGARETSYEQSSSSL